jgi:EpsI family protein
MNKIRITSLLTGIAMIAASLLAIALTPTKMAADTNPTINLSTLIPKQFGNWQQAQELDIISDPNAKAVSGKIYDQTLSRTYINTHGEQIMLTIAYGKDQRNGMQVHKPEACYPAQGFKITRPTNGTLSLTTNTKEIPVRRLVAVQGTRVEPITYWITVGDEIALDGIKWKLARLKYEITGKVPDGLVFRVSSIDKNYAHAYLVHAHFVNDLFGVLTDAEQARLAGNTIKQTTSSNNTIITNHIQHPL